jgi:3-oxoacyl-[acyl-carrier protein] reductase
MTPRKLIVTGASRGLGLTIGRCAVQAGYEVVGISKSGKAADAFEVRRADVSDVASLKEALSDLQRDETLYGLVNAAGVASMNLALATPPATVQRVIETNLLGAINVSTLVGKWLVRRRTGRIINFSTIAVPIALEGESVYVASKAGVEAFSRVLSRELAAHGITVNCVAPGPIDTDLIRGVPAAAIERIVQRQVIQTMATPEDVWDVVSLLLRPEARMITGEVLHVGGV